MPDYTDHKLRLASERVQLHCAECNESCYVHDGTYVDTMVKLQEWHQAMVERDDIWPFGAQQRHKATHWFYQIGDRWIATSCGSEDEWFADTDTDRVWTPRPRVYPINERPPFGTLYWVDGEGNAHTERVG